MREWLRIDEVVPKDGQDVFYYFGYFDQVSSGKYVKGDGEFVDNFFIGNGFVGDDVTYWMPRSEGDIEPEHPTPEQKAKDKYHPSLPPTRDKQ